MASSRYPGKKQVSAVVTLERWRALRDVATKTNRTHTELIAEAIDDLAVKYGEQPAPPKGKRANKPARRALKL